MAAHLDRMRAYPDIAGRVLRLEYTSVSLNPKAKLFGRHCLLEKFDPSRPADRPVLAAFEEELACPWALYHVRRILPVAKADPTRRGRALRSVERVDVGRASALGWRLRSISEWHGVPVEVDERYGRVRAWVQRRGPDLPTIGRGRYSGVGSSKRGEATDTSAHGRCRTGDLRLPRLELGQPIPASMISAHFGE
ncbi:hypothetical protein ACQEV2_42125 [Streptomyces sp. CA-251387]|uniref:hypothetical protein n=1 Tax=Streptomyces sp. CA-251387 TaxID=3240064 RepID=UPI003D92A16E